jgi:sodium pump decarboxylase gamma subunit
MGWDYILAIVFTGLAVVFAVLIFLIVLLKIMGRILSAKPVKKAIIVPRKISAPVIQKPKTDDLQVIAVIAAAIEAHCAAHCAMHSGKNIKIISVKKRGSSARSAWGTAGVSESMR